jgi:hypothetical protein
MASEVLGARANPAFVGYIAPTFNPMTLLQIAGGRTWPNFLPLLGYKPSKVIFLTGADPEAKFADSIAHLRTASHRAGHDVGFVQISTPTAQPSLIECRETLDKLASHEIALINLTGGSKAMTLAAWQFAKAHGIPSFHLDPRRTTRPFEDFGTAPHALPFPDLSAIAHCLNVGIALEAQGFPVPESFKQPIPEHLRFSVEAANLRSDKAADHEIGAEMAELRKALTAEDGSKFLRKGKLRPALQHPIVAEPGTAWHRYLEAATRQGILRQLDSGNEYLLVTLDPQMANSDDLHSQAETNFKLLEGIWFELALLERLQTSARFSDIRWSVEADQSTDPAASSKGETDLIAFNPETFNLHFLSCKTGGPHATALEHIQCLRRRATKEGGESAQAELWIFRPRSDDHRRDLENHCREQGVAFHVFTEEF